MHATPQQPLPRRREVLITLDMGEVAAQLAAEKEQQAVCGAGSAASAAGHAAASNSVARWVASCRFLCACAVGALHSMAPPALAAAEAACMLAVYLAAVPNAYPTHTRHLAYTFAGSAEDMVVLSLLRCAAITLAHCLGTGPLFQRPYLMTAAAFALVSLPLGLMKLLALVRHSSWPRSSWPAFVALYCLHMGFAAAQVAAAQRITWWARKRWEHGLGGLGYPWEEGEETWLLAGQLVGPADEEGGRANGSSGTAADHDVPTEQLADVDSRWARCGTLRVHYKLALPVGHRDPADTGVVLCHSFGGGTFSWRHVMQPLADACGMRVLAFDRPGFGLTDRPAVETDVPLERNPYALKCQALLTLQLCSEVGLARVAFVGHGDGAMLALMATAIAAREAVHTTPPQSPVAAVPAGPGGAASRPVGARTAPTAAVAPCYPQGTSFSESLDLAWMSGAADGPHTLLQQLLRGEWPSSIDPHASSAGAAGSWSPMLRRSPVRLNRRVCAIGGEAAAAQSSREPQLQPWLEAEEAQQGWQEPPVAQQGELGLLLAPGESSKLGTSQQQQGATASSDHTSGQVDSQPSLRGSLCGNPSCLSRPSTSVTGGAEAAGGLLHQQPSLTDNPSFLSCPSAELTGSTEAADACLYQQHSLIDNPSFLSQQTGTAGTEAARKPLHQQSSAGEEPSVVGNPSFLSQPQSMASSEAGEDGGGALFAQQSSLLMDNPSCISQASDLEEWEDLRYDPAEEHSGAPAAPAAPRLSSAEQRRHRRQQLTQPQQQLSQPAGSARVETGAAWAGSRGVHTTLRGGFAVGMQGDAASTQDASANMAVGMGELGGLGKQPAHQPGVGSADAELLSTTRGGDTELQAEMAQPADDLEAGWEGWAVPQPLGLVMLHPDLSGQVGPKYARVLAHSRLGRRVLRSLLRTEVGEVTNRRAWADPNRLTPALLALYRRPLTVLGWDLALTQVARSRNDIHSLERSQLLGAVVAAGLPVLVATGEGDHIAPPAAASRIAERLGAAGPRLAVLPQCGHLSHEEAPMLLLEFLQSFLAETGLFPHRQAGLR